MLKEERKSNIPDDLVIIAGKNIEKYVFATLLRFEKNTRIRLSSNYYHIGKLERIITLLKQFGVDEINREKKGNNRVEVTISK